MKYFMIENKKKIRTVFWIIVLSGSLLLGAAVGALEVSHGGKNALLAVWLVAVAVASVAIDLLWYRAFNRQLKSLQPILSEEGDPDRYIQEISALLEGKRSPQLRGVLLINLCAAYCDKREYDTAKALLLQVNPKKLSPVNRLVYWADLAYIHFHLQEDAPACAILTQQKDALLKFKESPHLGGLIAILSTFQKIAEGDKTAAGVLLAQARPQWQTARNAHDFEYLDQLCRTD